MLDVGCLELWLFVDSSVVSIVVLFHVEWCIRQSRSFFIMLYNITVSLHITIIY